MAEHHNRFAIFKKAESHSVVFSLSLSFWWLTVCCDSDGINRGLSESTRTFSANDRTCMFCQKRQPQAVATGRSNTWCRSLTTVKVWSRCTRRLRTVTPLNALVKSPFASNARVALYCLYVHTAAAAKHIPEWPLFWEDQLSRMDYCTFHTTKYRGQMGSIGILIILSFMWGKAQDYLKTIDTDQGR